MIHHSLNFRPIVLSLGILLAGCGKSVSLESWQDSVEQYVREQAGGDPAALRDLKIGLPGSGLAGISGMGDADPGKSGDVTGVLLGHRVVNARPVLVYLVGRVAQEKVKDMRLAAVDFTSPDPAWFVSEENDEAVGRYVARGVDQWRVMAGDAGEPARLRIFPDVDDTFRLLLDGNVLIAEHARSGARWTLTIPPAGQ